MAVFTEFQIVSKKEIALVLGLEPNSVKNYHNKWLLGVHYFKPEGAGKTTAYRYNKTLIQHWQQCHENWNTNEHQTMILEYRRSLNPRTQKRA